VPVSPVGWTDRDATCASVISSVTPKQNVGLKVLADLTLRCEKARRRLTIGCRNCIGAGLAERHYR
jgi:hypothetical protein